MSTAGPINLQQQFKRTYYDKIVDTRVSKVVLSELYPTSNNYPLGDTGGTFNIASALSQASGSHFQLLGVSPTTQVTPVGGDFGFAVATGAEITETMQISFGNLAMADQGKQVSFLNKQQLQMLMMYETAKRNEEWSLIYGGVPVATVSSFGTTTSTTAVINLNSR